MLLAAHQQEPVLSGKTRSCCSCPSAAQEHLLQVTHRACGHGCSSQSKWALPFCCREEFYSTLPQAAQKEEFPRWLKQADIPAESCHLPSSQESSHLLLALLGKQNPARQGRGRLGAPISCFGRQCFSTLAFPCESAGAQDLGSVLIPKWSQYPCWAGDVCSTWCHHQYHHDRRMWRWKRMQGS